MIISFEGRMGSGKSLSSTAMAYSEWLNRDILITSLDCVLQSMSWEDSVALLVKKHGMSEKIAGSQVGKAVRIYQEEGSEALRAPIKVISNNHLNFPYTHFDPAYFLEHIEDEEMEDCILLLDEAYQYFDGRSSSTKMNKLFTYFIVQTRKRAVDLYLCTHHIDSLDKRVRRAIDVRGTCRFTKGPVEEEKELKKRRYNWAITRFLDLRTGGRSKVRIYGPAFWHLYETKERIPLLRKQLEIEL